MTKAIRFITLTQIGTLLKTYVGASDAATQAQYDLISAGAPGTDGILNGVVCRYGELINPATLDAAGNATGTVSASFGNNGTPIYQTFEKSLGTPVAADNNAVLAAFALTAAPQTIGVADGLTNPDVPRVLTMTGNAVGNAGNVTVYGTDYLGKAISETKAINGNTLVNFTKAFATVTSADLPAETHAGTDTIIIGFSEKLGLPYRMDTDGILFANFGDVREATRPTVTFDANDVSKNTVDLNSALDGAHMVRVAGIRSDATFDSPINVNK